MRSALLIPLAGAALAAAGHAQTHLGTQTASAGGHLGAAAVPIGDYDGDGHRDLLVGAPYSSQGAVHVVSGATLAANAGSGILLTVPTPGIIGPVLEIGAALALVGDLTGDGVSEVVAGAPQYRSGGATVGALYLLDGTTIAILGVLRGSIPGDLGRAVAPTGDVNGDGLPDVAAAAPQLGVVYVVSGAGLQGFEEVVNHTLSANQGDVGFGTSIVSGFDYDLDGATDLLVGSPYSWSPLGGLGAGLVELRSALGSQPATMLFQGTVAGEHMGSSLDRGDDYDGDGARDFVVGAPDWTGSSGKPEGRAVIFSGASLGTGQNTILREYRGGVSGPNLNATGWRFGSSVRASGDLNGDGVGEYLVGMPDYSTQLPLGPGRGGGRVYSGATGDLMVGFTGVNNDRLGDMLLGAVEDYDGDGFPEFAVGGSLSDLGGTDAGRINLYSLYPAPARTYCTGKVNSLGCTPSVAWSGTASASAAAPFVASCSNVLNNKLGIFFFGTAPVTNPFQGGNKCVAPPVKRTPVQSSGGSPSGSDCSGSLSLDLNALIQSGTKATLVPGAEIYGQFWSRDPTSSFGSSFSNGLRFVVNP